MYEVTEISASTGLIEQRYDVSALDAADALNQGMVRAKNPNNIIKTLSVRDAENQALARVRKIGREMGLVSDE